MSAEPTPTPDPKPPAEAAAPPPAPTPETASPTPPPAAQVPQLREAIRPRKVQTRSELEDEEEEDPLEALGAQLQKLLGLGGAAPTRTKKSANEPESGVTAKNRRFASKATPAPATVRAPLPGAFETEVQPPAPGSLAGETTADKPDPARADAEKESPPKRVEPAVPREPAPPTSDRPAREVFRGQRRQERRRARRTAIWAMLAAGLALFLCFLLGRASVSVPPPSSERAFVEKKPEPTPSPNSTAWPPALLARLDAILVTDRAGKIEEAFTQADALRKEAGPLPGLDVYLSGMQTRLMRPNDANVTVSSLAAPTVPAGAAAAAYDQLGLVYSRQRLFPAAIDNFSRAAADNPFDGAYYYHWAEALRRRGKLKESLGIFDKALVRLPESAENDTLRQCVSLKARLASIEVGEGGQFKDKVDEALKLTNPSGYWLLTAAAIAMQGNRFPEAVDALQKAKAAMPPAQYEDMISDYFFRGFAIQNQAVNDIVMADSDERKLARRRAGAYFVDP